MRAAKRPCNLEMNYIPQGSASSGAHYPAPRLAVLTSSLLNGSAILSGYEIQTKQRGLRGDERLLVGLGSACGCDFRIWGASPPRPHQAGPTWTA